MTEKLIPTEQIMEAFAKFDGIYKQFEVEEAIRRREEFTPLLLESLERVLAEPENYGEGESDFFGYIYAVMLLGFFREPKAHDIILKLVSLPGEIPFTLFDYIITEEIKNILYRTSHGNWNGIRELIENSEANEFCRSAALDVLSFLVVFDDVPRQDIIAYMKSLFPKLIREDEPSDLLISNFARTATGIYPEELMVDIDKAFEKAAIPAFYLKRSEVEDAMKMGLEKTLEHTRAELTERFPEDNFHARMVWWHGFKRTNRHNADGSKILQTKTEKNRAKQKRRKQSKKKNKKKK